MAICAAHDRSQENKTVAFVGDSTNRIVWHAAECEAAKSPDALWRSAVEDGGCPLLDFVLPLSAMSIAAALVPHQLPAFGSVSRSKSSFPLGA